MHLHSSPLFSKSQRSNMFRITGLDPAGPLYASLRPILPVDLTLAAEDGKFVDIIHSDGNGFGSPQVTGSIDFLPNGGIHLQPGCPYTSGTFDINRKFLENFLESNFGN